MTCRKRTARLARRGDDDPTFSFERDHIPSDPREVIHHDDGSVTFRPTCIVCGEQYEHGLTSGEHVRFLLNREQLWQREQAENRDLRQTAQRLTDENGRLKRQVRDLRDERDQVLSRVDDLEHELSQRELVQ